MSLESEIKRRRTFAIISHPDAGKTTLTEKFLLYDYPDREVSAVRRGHRPGRPGKGQEEHPGGHLRLDGD